jgi:lysophospholipase L1-like esterase
VGVIASGADEAGQIVGGIVDFFSGLFGGDDSRPPRWQEPRAYRSYNSAPSLAAMELRNSSPTDADSVTFLSFARSGAQIRAGLIGPRENGRDNWIGRGEIDETRRAVANRRIDALLISIGGNDIGFAGSLNDLVKKDLLTWFGDGEVRVAARKQAEKRLTELPKALDELKREIDAKLNPRRVFILEYPTGLFEIRKDGKTRDGGPCGIFSSSLDFDLDIDEGRLVKRLGEKLNETIRRKSEEFGWIFISGIAEDFSGHGYCASQSFWISAEESCRNQGDFEGMMHPNAKGRDVIKNRILEALKTHVLDEVAG